MGDQNIGNISNGSNGSYSKTNYSDENKVRETSEIENKLFLSLKSHIDSQFKLNQLNQSRIRSYERFRRYCQRVDDGTKFDLEQFRNEYNRFDRNYRYWRKGIRKLRKETKSSLSNQNPYDILYELFAKILERNKDNNSKESEDQSPIYHNSKVISIDKSIQYEYFDGNHDAKFNTKRPRGRPPKSKVTQSQSSLSTDPEILINLIESTEISTFKIVPVNNAIDSNCDFSVENNEILNNSSDISNDKSVSDTVKKTIQTKKSYVDAKIKQQQQQNIKYKKNEVQLKPETFPKCSEISKKKSKGNRYRCDYGECPYSTASWSNLKSHINNIHTNGRPFQCDKCDKSYKLKAGLTIHQYIHEGIRFQCTFEGCDRNYSKPKQLQKHIKIIHTKEAPLLRCNWDSCQYSTYRGECLKTHRKIHEGQRTYKCPHCEMAFNSPSNLWVHKSKHENIGGYKCDFDGCRFSTHRISMFKNHQRIHSEERLFSCAWPGCGDSFKTPAGLSSHKLMHENLRRYKCSWDGCNYASNRSSGLKTHIQGVHEKKKNKKGNGKRILHSNLESQLFSSISK